jgi:hypothetical protein
MFVTEQTRLNAATTLLRHADAGTCPSEYCEKPR